MELPELVAGDIILTNMQRVYAPEIADQAIDYLLAFTRAHSFHPGPTRPGVAVREPGLVRDELMVIGLGGIDSEIARRVHPFGMRVVATDPKVLERPLYVEELHQPDAFHALLPRADVVSAAPLTRRSHGMIAAREFAAMKRGVVLINVVRGKVVGT